jgi:hypothetical protein
MMGQPGAAGEQQQKHYFDSIETDEFVMPNLFEVEIRLADNQVSLFTYLILYIDQNSIGGS